MFWIQTGNLHEKSRAFHLFPVLDSTQLDSFFFFSDCFFCLWFLFHSRIALKIFFLSTFACLIGIFQSNFKPPLFPSLAVCWNFYKKEADPGTFQKMFYDNCFEVLVRVIAGVIKAVFLLHSSLLTESLSFSSSLT